MDILGVCVLGFVLLQTLIGAYRGLFKIVYSFLSMILSLGIAIYLSMEGYSFAIAYAFCWIAFLIIGWIVGKLVSFPVIKDVNRMGGGILGFVKGMIWVSLILVVIYYINELGFLLDVKNRIEDSVICVIYEKNPILFLIDLFKKS